MQDEYVILTSWLFAVVALVHLLRIVMRWPVTIGSRSVPISLSWIGVVAAGVLAAWGGLGLL